MTGVHDAIHAPEQRTRWGRTCRYVLDPIYFYLDLLDQTRRPSHSKVTWTAVFIVAMCLWVFCTVHMVQHAIHRDVALSSGDLTFLLAYAGLMISTAGGLDGFKFYIKTKAAGKDTPAEPPKAAA